MRKVSNRAGRHAKVSRSNVKGDRVPYTRKRTGTLHLQVGEGIIMNGLLVGTDPGKRLGQVIIRGFSPERGGER